ncbi:MAG: zinc ribbon domain-containing protein [Lyngbya sp. HA4199-MV5]|jgi:NADH pyrophosphatase NudC (nudix superfamily)|nr:zinc ribbon domain-containing protein [Lyngbya sp. HA4199-MV5]
MAYFCDLGAGQSVYLENVHHQTLVTVANSHPGQQQQSSSGFQTGSWTAPPEVVRSPIGFTVKLQTDRGDWFVSIQGTRLSVSNEAPSWAEAQSLPVESVAQKPTSAMPPMQPMPPMPPMQPMTMGNMQMDQGAMSMQMGNMRLSMNPIGRSQSDLSHDQAQTTTVASKASSTADGPQKFCCQCGTQIKPGDRFCAHCGHQLNEAVGA